MVNDPWRPEPPRDEPRPLDDADALEFAAKEHARSLAIRERGRQLYDESKRHADTPPLDVATLDNILSRPAEPPSRIEGLLPSEAGLLIVAQRKTGKTTLGLNLARALIEGGTFLGRFDVLPVTGNVAILNYEVSGRQMAVWARDAGVPGDRLVIANLRGRRNPLADLADRAELAARLRDANVEAVIVDPFGRAYTGTSQNDSGEVGAWLADLDVFARSEVGARDVILMAHAGWNGERTRGSSALEDWADSIVTLTRDEQGRRFLRAEGRDVSVDEDALEYDHQTRTLSLTGVGSRKAAATHERIEELAVHVLEIVTAVPGVTGYRVGEMLRESDVPHQKGDHSKALNHLIDSGQITFTPGPRKAKCYKAVDLPRPTPNSDSGPNNGHSPHSDLPRPTPDLPRRGTSPPTPTTLNGWEGGGVGQKAGHLPQATKDKPKPCKACGKQMTFDDGTGTHAACEVTP